jgi:hypothetical protein
LVGVERGDSFLKRIGRQPGDQAIRIHPRITLMARIWGVGVKPLHGWVDLFREKNRSHKGLETMRLVRCVGAGRGGGMIGDFGWGDAGIGWESTNGSCAYGGWGLGLLGFARRLARFGSASRGQGKLMVDSSFGWFKYLHL